MMVNDTGILLGNMAQAVSAVWLNCTKSEE
jgi:hypothetical protein